MLLDLQPLNYSMRWILITGLVSGVMKGELDEVATTIQFKPDFENGALLTVGWSSCRIQHVPFSFLPQHLET
ncbi:hypothetical protein DAPPUDRAFT_274377 [Daphnia pulex]|uniref:Uncharacterized protein n=1 Tax=Daphnia pulex TaxID=6669 RepID=E9I456_DAPPU|nr:hypothetical protein DAPPUDRAFT_274377 [Daphnia pulex]|eukprot:EFX61224.1 hypothetical protein DAPPUDRAFT_274377 [Daphnia pulex]